MVEVFKSREQMKEELASQVKELSTINCNLEVYSGPGYIITESDYMVGDKSIIKNVSISGNVTDEHCNGEEYVLAYIPNYKGQILNIKDGSLAVKLEDIGFMDANDSKLYKIAAKYHCFRVMYVRTQVTNSEDIVLPEHELNITTIIITNAMPIYNKDKFNIAIGLFE